MRAVGVTLSQRQAELAAKRVGEAGLADRVEIRCQDYRDIDDGPYDAISSIGMFEHVGWTPARRTTSPGAASCSRPEGRLLNHGISQPPEPRVPNPVARLASEARERFGRGLKHDFFDRYVFPDGELHEVGHVVVGDPAGRASRRATSRASASTTR